MKKVFWKKCNKETICLIYDAEAFYCKRTKITINKISGKKNTTSKYLSYGDYCKSIDIAKENGYVNSAEFWRNYKYAVKAEIICNNIFNCVFDTYVIFDSYGHVQILNKDEFETFMVDGPKYIFNTFEEAERFMERIKKSDENEKLRLTCEVVDWTKS